MKINKTVEVSTYYISHSITCCLLHFIQIQRNALGVNLCGLYYIILYFHLYILTCLSPHQEELYTRENKLCTCIPDSFPLYVVVSDDRSDELKRAGENMYCKLYKFSPSAFCCWICISKMYHIYIYISCTLFKSVRLHFK